jgi:hypothetical protein
MGGIVCRDEFFEFSSMAAARAMKQSASSGLKAAISAQRANPRWRSPGAARNEYRGYCQTQMSRSSAMQDQRRHRRAGLQTRQPDFVHVSERRRSGRQKPVSQLSAALAVVEYDEAAARSSMPRRMSTEKKSRMYGAARQCKTGRQRRYLCVVSGKNSALPA